MFLGELTAFCAQLRRAGFTAGPAELADALRSADALGLLDAAVLERAWNLIFSQTREQAAQFPILFRAHFLNLPDVSPPRPEPPPPEKSAEPGEPTEPEEALASQQELAGGQAQPDQGRDEADTDAHLLQTRLSPHAGQGAPPALVRDEAAAYLEAARALLRGVRLGRSRRFVVGERGVWVDLRATLQAARRTGGEPLKLRYRRPPPRPPRVVLLLDGSRSMAPHAALLLRYAAALIARSRKVEVYSFSTDLTCLTPLLRAGQRIEASQGWGGGTRIGENLTRLLVSGRAHLRPDTLLLILSDGLDTGEPGQLAESLRKIRGRVGGVVWLNPLAGQIGYQPLARGMAAALPHLDIFAGVDGVGDLLALPGRVRRALR